MFAGFPQRSFVKYFGIISFGIGRVLLVNRFDILHKTGPSCNLCTAVPFNFFVNAVLPVLVFIAHLVHGLLCYEDAGTQSTSGLRRDETSRLGRQEEETL